MTESYFQDRLAYLGRRKEQIDSKTVVYFQADGTSFEWQASLGAVRVEETTSEGVVTEHQARDYIGPYGDVMTRTPVIGDYIIDGDLKCEVMAIAANTYLFTTERRERIRIHTKVVAQ